MLTHEDLATYISKNGITAEFVFLEKETPTVEAAADAVGVHTDHIGKSILFLADGKPILVISNGISKVSYRPIAQYLELSRRQVKLANSQEVLEHTGFAVGTVPPFGHIGELTTLVSNSVIQEKSLYAGGGSVNTLLKIGTDELVRVTRGRIVSL